MYNELYKAWKAEKTSNVPQPLPSDFYQRATGYLKGLEDVASGETNTIQARLLIKEKEMAIRLLEELKETRLRKIMSAAKNEEDISAGDLTDEEKTLIKNVNESLNSFNEKQIQKSEMTTAPEENPELMVIRFLQDIPEIVGVDLRIYGPFKKEDVASLPKQNAQALVKQGAAKPIEVRLPEVKQQETPINNK